LEQPLTVLLSDVVFNASISNACLGMPPISIRMKGSGAIWSIVNSKMWCARTRPNYATNYVSPLRDYATSDMWSKAVSPRQDSLF